MPARDERRLEDLLSAAQAGSWRDRLAADFFDATARERTLRQLRDHLQGLRPALSAEERDEVEGLVLADAALSAVPPAGPATGALRGEELADRVLAAYPHPVARPYLALTEAEPGAGAFGCLLDTFEGVVHFLAAVAVSAYLRGGLTVPECNRLLAQRLLKGLWSVGDLLALLRDTVRLAGDCGGHLPYAGLPAYLFDARGGPTESQRVLDAAREELPRSSVAVETLHCDVTDRNQVVECVRKARDFFGPIDVLVNNAGIISVAPLEEMRLEDFERSMRTHFYGPLYMTMEVLPEMRQRRRGRIVNISSLGGKIAVPHMLPYTASKFALTGFSEGLRNELRKENIFVTTVCPSPLRTGSHLQAEFKGRHELEYLWFAGLCGIPGLSVGGEAAARAIVRACARGDAELLLGLPARAAVLLKAVSPELLALANELVNQFLPGPGGIGTQSAKGYESRGATPELLTTLPDRAARRNNETNQEAHLALSTQGEAT